MDKTLARLNGRNDMAEFTGPLKEGVERLKSVTLWMTEAGKADPNARPAAAVDYLKLFGLTAFAWAWVLMIEAALLKTNDDADFAAAKVLVGRYFMQRVLPQTISLDAVIRSGSQSMMALKEGAF